MKMNPAAVLAAVLLALPAPGALAQLSNAEVKERLAYTKIEGARYLISVKKFHEAREELTDILLDASLSDEVRGTALLQKGNIGMHISDYKAAERDYLAVLQLPGASAKLKNAAKQGADFATSFANLRK
jgi:hypothetical protein